MRHCKLGWFAPLIVAGNAAVAEVNCTAIAAFDRLHDAEIRLLQYENTTLFTSEIEIIRSELQNIAGISLETAFGSNHLAQNSAVFEDFIANSQHLLRLADQGNRQGVRRHLAHPNVRQNRLTLTLYLRSLPCNVNGPTVSFQTIPNKDQGDTENWFKVIPPLYQITIIGVLLALAAIGAKIIHLLRSRHKRRATRYTANYATRYQVKGDVQQGVLLDISGRGTKLRHAPDNEIPLQTEITLEIEGDWKAGTVVWSNTHYSGVLFQRALRRNTVQSVHSARPNPKQDAA